MSENYKLQVSEFFQIGYKSGKGNAKRITKENVCEFWEIAKVAAYAKKQGCYIFALRAAKGFVPWYVGKTSKGFLHEVFTDHKLNHYNDILFKGNKGTPVIFFVAPPGSKNKFPAKMLKEVEKELIHIASGRNPQLCNTHNTKNLPQWSINGVIRSSRGKPTNKEQTFRKMLNI